MTFFRCPRRSLKISSCSWYSARVKLSKYKPVRKKNKQTLTDYSRFTTFTSMSTYYCLLNQSESQVKSLNYLYNGLFFKFKILISAVTFSASLNQTENCCATHSWGKDGLRKGSESLPLTTLVFRCLGSEVEATASEGDAGFGGFLLASSFLCRSMSSLCWLMPSCCLFQCRHRNTRK